MSILGRATVPPAPCCADAAVLAELRERVAAAVASIDQALTAKRVSLDTLLDIRGLLAPNVEGERHG